MNKSKTNGQRRNDVTNTISRPEKVLMEHFVARITLYLMSMHSPIAEKTFNAGINTFKKHVFSSALRQFGPKTNLARKPDSNQRQIKNIISKSAQIISLTRQLLMKRLSLTKPIFRNYTTFTARPDHN